MKKNIRVVIPRKVLEFLILCLNIITKNTADGINSVLSSINMTEMGTRYTAANAANILVNEKSNTKELAVENRNIALGIKSGNSSYLPNTILWYVSSIRDFLLGTFKGNERQLGLWGFEVNSSKTVVVSRSPLKLLTLARGIITKHTADGVGSILEVFDMTAFEDLLTLAEGYQSEALTLSREKELEIEKRNNLMGFGKGSKSDDAGTLLKDVTAVRDVLLGVKKGSEQELGLWGFEVNTSAPPPDPDPEPYVLSGLVTSTVGATPIGNAMLTFNTSMGPLMTNTNPLGEYSLETPITADESANVTIMAMGFQPFAAPIMLTPEGSGVFNFELTPE
ncbi:MAG: hypothetical protein Q8K70_03465 [Bacteroidota bacterium]|nr:hypothetical protein [Bacteroidota bacterium]